MGERRAGGLAMDLYEIRIAASYLRGGMTDRATFSVFARKLPPDRGFLVASGLDDVLASLTGFGFTPGDLAYLRDAAGLRASDVAVLAELRCVGSPTPSPPGSPGLPREYDGPCDRAATAAAAEDVVSRGKGHNDTVTNSRSRCRSAAGTLTPGTHVCPGFASSLRGRRT